MAGLPRSGCGERSAESPWGAALAIGLVGLLPGGGRRDLLKGAEAGRRQARSGSPVLVTLADLTVPLACPLTAARSSPRRMFSSVAHLARANPFNAPHLQLVHDGLAGPRSSPAGPPGPPRRSRNLAAAAVEGEVSPWPARSWCPLVVGSAFAAWAPPGGRGRTRPVACPKMSALSALGRCPIRGPPSRAWTRLGTAPSVTSTTSRE